MRLRVMLFALTILLPLPVFAEIATGGRVPDLSITDKGQLGLSDEKVVYSSWSYDQKPGKVQVVQYMAATRSASAMNKPFREKMRASLPLDGSFESISIVNLDEAMWGTSGMVISELKSSKTEFPYAVMVVDENGLGLTTWQLEKESSAVIVTNEEGEVLYFKEGALSEDEIDSTIKLINDAIGKSGTKAKTAS
ncbi:MAG: YtfJ family protein [Pseudomonadota bacterium]